jgi:hypothetical protein
MLKACTATVAVGSLCRLEKAITQPTGMLQPDFYYLLLLHLQRLPPLLLHWTILEAERHIFFPFRRRSAEQHYIIDLTTG